MLDRIHGPQDVQALSRAELPTLADELRRRIIEVCASNGGHLAPSLGVVELTIALHSVFSSPDDKIIWDVGHQSYPHKLLTGRNDRFQTLRQQGGIAGFPERDESPHDHFGTAHASTSISAALGMAQARDLAGRGEHIVAVVGDGALSGGLAYEALNNAGQLKTNFIVVLNDNEFSIAPNVGAMSAYLGMLRAHPTVQHTADFTKRVLRRVPFGGAATRAIQSAESAARRTISALPKATVIFEEMGFSYIGPCNGHDVNFLIDALQAAKRVEGPVLLHAVTVKGKGYEPAQGDARTFHGCGSFDAVTGAFAKKAGATFSSAFGAEAIRLAAHDERVVAITAAMPDGTGLKDFAKTYPARFFDVGIAEAHATCFAAGAAAAGLRPLVAIYSTFLQRAYDQIVHDVSLQRLPVTFCIDRAGLVGDDGKTHQGAYDVAYLRTLPNMVVMAPATEVELAAMMQYAQAVHDGRACDGGEHEGPIAIRYPRGASALIEARPDADPIRMGRAHVLRTGAAGGVALVALGICCDAALWAADELAREGVSIGVVNARFVKPLDTDLLSTLAGRYRTLVTIEEHSLEAGFGSAVVEALSDRNEKIQVVRLGIADRTVAHASQTAQRAECGLDAAGIARSVRSVCRSTGTQQNSDVALGAVPAAL
ncbi:MAG: 1-deoxy-D-xylulose-5-phosphate synthase [Candidatus Eremiobacteraeota bacterium]|nr:1-deoxy-D-xylulose-5-phosphate synthase [Candidatus Eremiobacteraeota bacterium]MBC5826145.1 1-deoxy-D-xylulose-5-phosphate synthase [Candidatus Eremiobacteraeota bacterium]